MKNKILIAFFLSLSLVVSVSAQKTVYIPRFITRTNMDLNNNSSQWSYARSRESENIVVFWEPGFGSDPSTASGNYRVNMNTLLEVAEKSYSVFLDSLKFVIKGSSVTDRHKLMIFLLYTLDWGAWGSGQDDLVGSLHVNPAAANIKNVVAHEIGHCFQYLTGCDSDGGYRYGFGPNGSGGNGFWEQCANWKAFKVYPELQFTDNVFRNYIRNNHLHILHEAPRYANYFLPDFWTYKRGRDFMGKLWRDSRRPEDPVETYKRLNSLSQDEFNDEMYEHAARLTTWDLPEIKSYGQNYIDTRAQVRMNLTSDGSWEIDRTVCPMNYGYNSIKLNAPSRATDVTVNFKGRVGASGFRAIQTDRGGWRFGFVALQNDGTRVYSDVGVAKVTNGNNPSESLTFSCPANTSRLWLVVSGSPQVHWRHPWDDDVSNDEQWPYQVDFRNTNLLGSTTEIVSSGAKTGSVKINPVISGSTISLPQNVNWQLTDLAGKQISSGHGNSIDIARLSNGGYILRYSGKLFRVIKTL